MSREHRDFARDLRRAPTDAEQHVWSKLRRRQLGGHRFRRQHPLGKYTVDFVCLERRLIVELDGGQHGEAGQMEHDRERDQWLKGDGFRVLRFWNHQVFEEWDDVAEEIWRCLESPG